MAKVSFPMWKSYEYVEVFRITEYSRSGAIKATQSLGFAHRSRIKQEGEVYASLSTGMLRGKETIELELLEE